MSAYCYNVVHKHIYWAQAISRYSMQVAVSIESHVAALLEVESCVLILWMQCPNASYVHCMCELVTAVEAQIHTSTEGRNGVS